jgi:hypothetical protein
LARVARKNGVSTHRFLTSGKEGNGERGNCWIDGANGRRWFVARGGGVLGLYGGDDLGFFDPAVLGDLLLGG